MALHPVFQRKPFRRTALTNSINTTVRFKREFDALFPWIIDTSPVDKVQINIGHNNVMDIVPMTPRDGVPPVIGGNEREAVEIKIPSFAGRATIYNAEALGVIAGLEGDQVDENLQNLINGRHCTKIHPGPPGWGRPRASRRQALRAKGRRLGRGRWRRWRGTG